MKAVEVYCTKHRESYWAYLPLKEYWALCEKCQQYNRVNDESYRITGVCEKCGVPYDDFHNWEGAKAVCVAKTIDPYVDG